MEHSIDMEKVIKEYEDYVNSYISLTTSNDYEFEMHKAVLALLKEQEAKTGHWIDTTNTIGFPRCECSECNSEAGAIWMKYCPNCGAKMEGR